MKAIDRAILALVSLSLSLLTAAAFLLWMAERRNDLEFAPSLALSALVGLVMPLAAVAVTRRLRPQLSVGWFFALYMIVCAVLVAAFAIALK